MVGYATREIHDMIPTELATARAFLQLMWNKYHNFRDAKCQVTMKRHTVPGTKYDHFWKYDTVVVSPERMDDEVIKEELIDFFNIRENPESIRFFINPC